PQVLHLAAVGSLQRKALVVLRPADVARRGARTELLVGLALLPRGVRALPALVVLADLLIVLLLLLTAAAPASAAVRVVLFAVGRELRFLDGGIGRILLGELEVLRVHHEEIHAAGEDDRLLVR